MKRSIVILICVILASGALPCARAGQINVEAFTSYPIHNINTGSNYTSIQSAINANETMDGHAILVDSGTYSEHVLVNKSVSIMGANKDETIIDGGGGVIFSVVAVNVTIQGFTVRRGIFGIFLDHSNNSQILDCNVIENEDAILAYYSHNCTVNGNVAANNTDRGILITNTMNFSVNNNLVYGNDGYGLNANASINGLIAGNVAYGNGHDGIGLSESTNCIVEANNITNNVNFGVLVDYYSRQNLIFHNNIIDNGVQAAVSSANSWDNGIEGNYWSSYTGEDHNNDGIGDTPYIVGENNTDNDPLMGTFFNLGTTVGPTVNIVTNSTVGGLFFSKSDWSVQMYALNFNPTVAYGFCRVSIPHTLMIEPYSATVDDSSPDYLNLSVLDNGNTRWIYLAYHLGRVEARMIHTVMIQGQQPLEMRPPVVSVISPENKTYATGDVALTFTVNKPTPWVGYSLDGQMNVTISGNTTMSIGSEGNHTIIVYAQDAYGNIGASEIVQFSQSAAFGGLFFYLLVGIAVVVIVVVLLVYLKKFRKESVQVK